MNIQKYRSKEKLIEFLSEADKNQSSVKRKKIALVLFLLIILLLSIAQYSYFSKSKNKIIQLETIIQNGNNK